ncbi:MAG: UDP-glucose 4-epimerase GalE [Alteromonadaceae bacterium]|nr:UDP-glucose 4-epimerase GalE [Alteromonadaceae bacterium]
MKVLITGGAGYIGSHTTVELINSGYDVIVIDNLQNSTYETVERVKQITGKSFDFFELDLTSQEKLNQFFDEQTDIDAVIHFAALKSVAESTKNPLDYYRNNVCGTINLLNEMQKHGIGNLVFSSSATVYGNSDFFPIKENFPTSAINPYGRTKLMGEHILGDLAASNTDWSIALLRYFNPVGAHESGLIGESPRGIPNNLMPFIAQVASGKRSKLKIYGNDYPTDDGTGVRDYIHVVDLARGHLKALEKIKSQKGISSYNLGTGRGYSVLEMVKAFEQASGQTIPYEFAGRREGDVAECWADTTEAEEELQWRAEKTLAQMMIDMWRWEVRDLGEKVILRD